MRAKAEHYSMIIQWSEEDQALYHNCARTSRMQTHGETYEEAVKQGKDAIEGWIEVAENLGWDIPAHGTYTGATA